MTPICSGKFVCILKRYFSFCVPPGLRDYISCYQPPASFITMYHTYFLWRKRFDAYAGVVVSAGFANVLYSHMFGPVAYLESLGRCWQLTDGACRIQ
jgi:hypothetical protein